ncbi:MAG: hypothetical protein ACT4QE_18745 [Anaerolineales bacterium]
MLSRLLRHYPYLFVIATPVILFAPFLIGVQMIYWGTPLLQFYPWRYFALESLHSGFLPLWNPLVGSGAPLIANYQSALFYPPNWLSLVMPLDLSLNWLMVLHIVWAGVGMVVLARSLGYQSLGQCVAGLAFGMGQHVVARASFYSINAAVAWMPWVVWAVEEGIRDKGQSLRCDASRLQVRGVAILSAILAFQLLAGHAQTTWYTWLLVGAWVVWRLIAARDRLMMRRAFILLPSSFLPALLIAAIQLLPTAELLRLSPRADAAEYEFVMTYSFSPWRLLTLLAPDLLGNPARGRFYGYGNYLEDAVYAGVMPLLLALTATASAFRSKSQQHTAESPHYPRFLVFLLPLALLLALGRNTPVFPFLYQFAPSFNLFQAPTRMMIWFVFALSLLAGWGADPRAAHSPPRGRQLYWTRLGAAGAVSIVLTCIAALFIVSPATEVGRQLLTVAQAVLVAGINLFIAAILSLLKPEMISVETTRWVVFRRGVSMVRWELLVAVCLAGDLIYANAGIHPPAPADVYRSRTESGAALVGELNGRRLFYFPDEESTVKFDPFFSFLTYGDSSALARGAREAQLPNVSVIDGLASANNFDPLAPERYFDFIQVVSETRSTRLLNLMNVGAVASRTPLPDWEPITHGDGVTFYRVPGESRRVWLLPAEQAVTVTDAASAWAALADPNFDPAQSLILEAGDSGAITDQSYPGPASTSDPNAFVWEGQVHREMWLVLADTDYPGWAVYDNGNAAVLRRADLAFRAVLLAPGEHRVEFRYQPRSFLIGAWLSGAGVLLWLALALIARRR